MVRKKKVVANTSDQNTTQELSKQEVWDVVSFAKNMLEGIYPAVLTPELVAARMKDLSFMPKEATAETLARALQNPKEHENELRSFIEMFEIISMPLKRIMSYMADLAAFDLTYTSKQKSGEKTNYKAKAYDKDLKVIYDFLDDFEYRQAFRDIAKNMLRRELFVGCFRDTGNGIVIQELPVDRCKITGRWGHGYLVSFDMMYFWQPGVDLRMYPKFFTDKFNELFKNQDGTWKYNPSLPPTLRGQSSYVYWVDLPPEIGWAFKLDMSVVTSIPYFAALMPDLIDQNVMRSLQKDTNMAAAAKIVMGEVPLLKDTKASLKDMISIDPKTLGQFLALVKSALSAAIKVASAPLENMKAMEFKENNEMYDTWMRTAVASSGMNSALFYSSKLKANAIESQLSLESDAFIMLALYPQFEGFMNYFANKRTSKHRFYFRFEGTQFYLSRQQRLESATSLANMGVVLPQKFSAALGMKPQEFDRMLDESKSLDFVGRLTPIVPAFQQGAGQGRPQKSDSERSDSGTQTRSDGGNISKGGNV